MAAEDLMKYSEVHKTLQKSLYSPPPLPYPPLLLNAGSLFKLPDSNSANPSEFISKFGHSTFFPLIKFHQNLKTTMNPWL